MFHRVPVLPEQIYLVNSLFYKSFFFKKFNVPDVPDWLGPYTPGANPPYTHTHARQTHTTQHAQFPRANTQHWRDRFSITERTLRFSRKR